MGKKTSMLCLCDDSNFQISLKNEHYEIICDLLTEHSNWIQESNE